jgi:hypothetical protein
LTRTFGISVFPAALVLKASMKWFEYKDNTVRARISELAVEMYRWLGESVMEKQIKDLRPAQVLNFQHQFSPVRLRILKKHLEQFLQKNLNL